MEGEGAWSGFKGAFRRLFLNKKAGPPLTSSRSSSTSSESYRSALEGDDNFSFVRDTPELPMKSKTSERTPLVSVRRRESRSLSPKHLYAINQERKKSLKPIIKDPKDKDEDTEPTRGRSKNRVTIDEVNTIHTASPDHGTPQRSKSEERAQDSDGSDGVQSSDTSLAQQRLEILIRERGYHVKKHIPKKVLEERILGNIRRREKIAIMMRNEAAKAAGCTSAIITADDLAQNVKPLPRSKTTPAQPSIDPMRVEHVLGLVSKVWTKQQHSREESQEKMTSTVPSLTRQQFIEDTLKAHNKYRELHAAPPLVLDEQLTEDAQIWANRIAEKNILSYSTKDGRGENIMTTTTARGGLTGKGVTNAWYEKGRNFNYNVNELADTAIASSFTQVIWYETKKLGVGMTRGEEGRLVAVARYWPKGNIKGKMRDNVLPLIYSSPFEMNHFSKTREEANLNVQTALIAPAVCLGVAKRLNRELGVESPKARAKRKKKLLKFVAKRPPYMCPNGRMIKACCGPPSVADANINISPTGGKQNFQVLSPSNLASANAYQKYNPNPSSSSANIDSISSSRPNRTQTSYAFSNKDFLDELDVRNKYVVPQPSVSKKNQTFKSSASAIKRTDRSRPVNNARTMNANYGAPS